MKINSIVFFIAGLLVGLGIMYLIMHTPASKKNRIEVSHAAVVRNVEQIGNLEVVKYNVRDVIQYQKIRQWLPNARTALMIAGEVSVGVDLSKVSGEDIRVEGDTVYLLLPQPNILHVKIDHSASRIYNMDFGLWESEKIADEAYREAERYLEEEAVKLNYRQEAQKNANTLLTPILEAMGFKHVVISFTTQEIYPR